MTVRSRCHTFWRPVKCHTLPALSYAIEGVMRGRNTRSAILQVRLTEQERADFIAVAVAQKKGWYVQNPSGVLRDLVLEFTKKHLHEVKE